MSSTLWFFLTDLRVDARRPGIGRPAPRFAQPGHVAMGRGGPLFFRLVQTSGDGQRPPAPFPQPVCLAGRGDCPPEDCGGIHRYDRLPGILDEPKHEEHRNTRAWAGGWLAHGRFDRRETNAVLRRLCT